MNRVMLKPPYANCACLDHTAHAQSGLSMSSLNFDIYMVVSFV